MTYNGRVKGKVHLNKKKRLDIVAGERTGTPLRPQTKGICMSLS